MELQRARHAGSAARPTRADHLRPLRLAGDSAGLGCAATVGPVRAGAWAAHPGAPDLARGPAVLADDRLLHRLPDAADSGDWPGWRGRLQCRAPALAGANPRPAVRAQ